MSVEYGIELTAASFFAIVVLSLAARRLGFPFPVLLVFAGVGLGISPSIPDVSIDPDLIFLGCLPPLLYSAAIRMSWHEFRENLIPIGGLAIGLVLATTAAVAAVAYQFIPGMTIAGAAVLGAIVAPTDVVAATAIARRLGIPERVVTILEGESLVNDASSLVAYRVAVTAVVTGFFSWQEVTTEFLLAGVGGAAAGVLLGNLVLWLFRRIDDTAAQITLSLAVPYVAFLSSEQFELSGVLAVVATGLTVGRKNSEVSSASSRINASAVFATIEYLMNGVIFLLIGMQLQGILSGLRGWSTESLVTYAALITSVVVLMRLIWTLPLARFASLFLGRMAPSMHPALTWKQQILIGWSGMRGVVSLAAALALPLTTHHGAAFPDRGLIIFLTGSVVLATLVLTSLTLPLIARSMRLEVGMEERDRESKARETLLTVSVAEFDRRRSRGELPLSADELAWVRNMLDGRLNFAREIARTVSPEDRFAALRFYMDILEVERAELRSMFRRRDIKRQLFSKLEHEIDLEEARMRSMMGERAAEPPPRFRPPPRNKA